jgi:hypothetical protein
MLSKEISEFGMLIADEDSYEEWQRRRWLEEEELALQEEEMLDRRERAQDKLVLESVITNREEINNEDELSI